MDYDGETVVNLTAVIIRECVEFFGELGAEQDATMVSALVAALAVALVASGHTDKDALKIVNRMLSKALVGEREMVASLLAEVQLGQPH